MSAADSPLDELRQWLENALAAGVAQPDAMALATATRDGRPSVRFVLLKGVDSGGVTFYTDRRSRKGAELQANPAAAVALYWQPLHRQVRLEGRVRQLTAAESAAYWVSRPRESRAAAAAFPQSTRIASREELLEAYQRQLQAPGDPPRPREWGGYRLIPAAVEFWEGDPNRLHDRRRYVRHGSRWRLDILSP